MADDQKKRPEGPSRETAKSGWLGQTLKLESEHWSKPRSVEIAALDREDLVVKLKGDPPGFGEVVRLRAPGAQGARAWLTGEVVVLERIRQGGSGVKVTIQLVEPAVEALTRLPLDSAEASSPSTPSPSIIDKYLKAYTSEEAPLPDKETPRPPRRRPAPIVEPVSEDRPSRKGVLGGYSFTGETTRRRTRPQLHSSQEAPEEKGSEPSHEAPRPERWSPGLSSDTDQSTPSDKPAPSTGRPLFQTAEATTGRSVDRLKDALKETSPAFEKRSMPAAVQYELHRGKAPKGEPQRKPEAPTKPAGPAKPEEEEPAAVHPIESRASSTRRGVPAVRTRTSAPVIGIDFGTTYSKVAVLDNDEVVLLEDGRSYSSSRSAIPSVVALSTDGRFLVGESAREMLAVSPERVISSVKRVAGLRYSDPLAHGLLGSLACPSFAGPNDSIMFRLDEHELTVPDVISRILTYLLQLATEWAGSQVTRAVLTYPVDFDVVAKRELELAARMAGIQVLAMVPEPVAAVMGVGVDRQNDAVIAVYDFGGGTFDASVVEVGSEKFKVLGSAGDRWLGGDDLDELLARHTADVYSRSKGIDLATRQEEFQRLLFACEETKRLLTTLEKVDVILPNAGMTAAGPQVLMVPVERTTFEGLAEYVITSSLEISKQAATAAGRDPKDADILLLTGGTSRIPVIRSAAERFFGRQGVVGIHPEHAVVIGAAIQAATEAGEPVPEDFAHRLQEHARPGFDISLVDDNGSVEPIFEADQTPPVAEHLVCTLTEDQQTAFRLELVEGLDARAEENRSLGRFVVDGLPPRPPGQTELNLYFVLTTTGTLHVTAQDRASGQRARASFSLTEK